MIRLEDVHLSLSGRSVLRGIDLEVGPGDRIVVMGESGGGKSTILRTIAGLLPPDRGRVLVEGRDIYRTAAEELRALRRKLALVFQGGALFDTLTVGENVGYRLFEEGRLAPAEIEEKVRATLASVDLEEAIDLYPAQLSGGMRKRVAIARALAAEPEYILFDEPTAGLDPVAASAVNGLIRACQRAGTATLVVTHDLDCAFFLGQSLNFLADGKIVFQGGREEMQLCRQPDLVRFLHPKTVLQAGEVGR